MKSLERLETFLVLCECGSYTRAAQLLYCSQPTISHHIAQLEADYGVSLLEKSGKNFRVTKQGAILRDYANQIMSLVKESEYKISQSMRTENHILSLYVSNYVSEYFLSDVLMKYYRALPNHQLEIHSYCYNDLRKYMMQQEASYSIMPIYQSDQKLIEDFKLVPIFEEPFVLVVSKDHPWSTRKKLFARDLNHETILVPQSEFLGIELKNALAKMNCNLTFLQMSNFSLIKNSILSGYGISFLPYTSVQKEIEQDKLVTIDVAGFSYTRTIGIFINNDMQLSELEQLLIEQIQIHFHNINPILECSAL